MQGFESEGKLGEEKAEASCILKTPDLGNHQGSTLRTCYHRYHDTKTGL